MSYIIEQYFRDLCGKDPVDDFDRCVISSMASHIQRTLVQVHELNETNKRLTKAIESILAADERGGGILYAEAMDNAAKLIGYRNNG